MSSHPYLTRILDRLPRDGDWTPEQIRAAVKGAAADAQRNQRLAWRLVSLSAIALCGALIAFIFYVLVLS